MIEMLALIGAVMLVIMVTDAADEAYQNSKAYQNTINSMTLCLLALLVLTPIGCFLFVVGRWAWRLMGEVA